MAADLTSWLSAGSTALRPTTKEADRAALAWRRINDKPASIVFRTESGTTLAAQTVRIESDNTTTESASAAGVAARRGLVVFGVRNHEVETDTDMAAGYRFNYNDSQYRIQSVILTLGEIQGLAEAVS